jgi:hypothetical protein
MEAEDHDVVEVVEEQVVGGVQGKGEDDEPCPKDEFPPGFLFHRIYWGREGNNPSGMDYQRIIIDLLEAVPLWPSKDSDVVSVL